MTKLHYRNISKPILLKEFYIFFIKCQKSPFSKSGIATPLSTLLGFLGYFWISKRLDLEDDSKRNGGERLREREREFEKVPVFLMRPCTFRSPVIPATNKNEKFSCQRVWGNFIESFLSIKTRVG